MDVAIIETGNGGDLQLVGNDLAVINGIENMPYLGLFGGNPGYVTSDLVQDEQSFDFWGNNLLFISDPVSQFNSLFENAINTIPLTSSGRVQLEDILKKDLSFLSDQGSIDVSVAIVATDQIQISLTIKQNTNTKVKVINMRKRSDGDFRITDFNDDFFL